MRDDAMSANLLDAEPAVAAHALKRPAQALDELASSAVRAAMLARYKDLSSLRYDYPLVLSVGEGGGDSVRSLSGIVDSLLQQIAPRGIEGERVRPHVLRLEREIRALVVAGKKGSLSQVCELAQSNVLSRAGAADRAALEDSLTRARAVLAFEGELIDCNENTPVALLRHLWNAVENDKAQQFHTTIDRIILGLSDILKVDFIKSDDARTPERLKHSVGSAFESAFDFEAMSQLLGGVSRKDALPKKRRERIEAVLTVLKSQRFFPSVRSDAKDEGHGKPYGFVFDNCRQALDAFEGRLPEMVELVKAIAIAGLELDNRYRESAHESFFQQFDHDSLRPEDLVFFPSYLVCMRDGDYDAGEQALLVEALSSGLPINVLLQSEDILPDLSVSRGKFSLGRRGSQLASMAVGLHSAYVLQASNSHLYSMRDQIMRGLLYDGPALFSVYTGAGAGVGHIPPYLVAAAAMESRAFPAFTYDPAAGPDLASRFCIDANPQAERDWPAYQLEYEDEEHQRISEQLSFTFADFVACDKRYAGRFATLPRSQWSEAVVPLAGLLTESDASTDKIPYVPIVDGNDVLQKLAVDDELIRAVRRCAELWRSLQELGGIHSSHAQRLLAKEKELWQQQKEHELAALEARSEKQARTPDVQQAPSASVETAQTPLEAPAEAPSDEAYIETPRCTTCDECIQINGRMFAYDENKQAYIADLNAGTYRELVEAAESCQVAIIHPGKPGDRNEPNLEELIKRAEPFR
jgi:hypothetical protein